MISTVPTAAVPTAAVQTAVPKKTKKKTKKTNKVVPIDRSLPTPDATPDVEDHRVEADKERQQLEENTLFVTSRGQPPNSEDDSSDNETDVLQAVLGCGKDEHRKILGIKDDADEDKIEDALWNRGTDVHPKYNQNPEAQKAFDSMNPLI
jgi:hypothetical protein